MNSSEEVSNIGKKYGYLINEIDKFKKEMETISDYIEMDLEEDVETSKQILAIIRAIKVYYKTLEFDDDSGDSGDSDSSSEESITSVNYDNYPSKDICHSCCGACKLKNIENPKNDKLDEESFELNLQI